MFDSIFSRPVKIGMETKGFTVLKTGVESQYVFEKDTDSTQGKYLWVKSAKTFELPESWDEPIIFEVWNATRSNIIYDGKIDSLRKFVQEEEEIISRGGSFGEK